MRLEAVVEILFGRFHDSVTINSGLFVALPLYAHMSQLEFIQFILRTLVKMQLAIAVNIIGYSWLLKEGLAI